MAYTDITASADVLLKPLLTQDDVDEATRFVDDVARSLNVDPSRIPVPAPYKVGKLAYAYMHMNCAKNYSAMVGADGGGGADAYELKRRVYAAEVNELTQQMTAETMLGGKPARKGISNMKIMRC